MLWPATCTRTNIVMDDAMLPRSDTCLPLHGHMLQAGVLPVGFKTLMCQAFTLNGEGCPPCSSITHRRGWPAQLRRTACRHHRPHVRRWLIWNIWDLQ